MSSINFLIYYHPHHTPFFIIKFNSLSLQLLSTLFWSAYTADLRNPYIFSHPFLSLCKTYPHRLSLFCCITISG